MKFITTGI